MKEYSKLDHSHCFESENPPCGVKGKHRCCLCQEAVPHNQSVEEVIEEIIHTYLLVACEGKERAVDTFCLKAWLTEVAAASRREALIEARQLVLNSIGLEMNDKFEEFFDRFDEKLQELHI